MCQAKITDHYGGKYKCLRPDVTEITVSITYGYGHMKGKTRAYTRTFCSKHGKTFRYNAGVKRRKGHDVILTSKNLTKDEKQESRNQ